MRIATAALALLLLPLPAGCGEHKTPVPSVPSGAKAGTVSGEACRYKQGKQEYPARCGFLYVPENRDKAASRLIALPYTRILAGTRTPGAPLFYLAGGPGQTNLSLPFPATWFLAKRDVVMLGYRGVDGSVRLDCPEVNAALKAGGLLEREDMARIGASFRACAARLEKGGIDLSGYTMLETAGDLEAARRALGYGRIDLLGISYGTRLGLLYGWRYPENVERSILIGVNPPGRFWLDPAILDRQIRRYGALCAADAYCSARTKDLAADMRKALAAMPERWLGFPVNRDAVLFASFLGLYGTGGAAGVFDMWIAAAHGDYSGMALASLAFAMMTPPMVMGEAAAKGGSADFGEARDCEGLLPGRTLLGAPLDVFGCAASGAWPVKKIPAEYRKPRYSAVETLMLSGSLDVSTPAENAREELLPLMPNARQVMIAEASHAGDLLFQQKEATRQLLTAFLDTGRVEARFVYKPVNFDPGWLRLPLIAKALLGAGLLLAALILWLAVWIVRRLRRAGKAPAKAAPG